MESNSVLDLLKFNMDELLFLEEDFKKVEIINSHIKFIDYNYLLPVEELGIFDKAIIRIFGEEKFFYPSVNTHVTLNTTIEPTLASMINAIERMVNIYGDDNLGQSFLTHEEILMLEKRDFWPGRTWDFNQNHQLWKLEDGEDLFAYSVIIKYDSREDGFSLVIYGYNRLIELFGD